MFPLMRVDPSSPPANVTAEVQSPTFIEVRWEEVPLIDQNGIITDYEIVYEPDTFGGSPVRTSFNVSASSTGTTLSGLEEYVRYNITVRAFTSVGPGPYSTPLISVTDEDSKSIIIG